MPPSKAASAVAALSALVALLSLMNSVRPRPTDLLEAMRQARKGLQRGGHFARRHAEAHGRCAGGKRVLDVVPAAQGADAGKIGEGAERTGPGCACHELAAHRVPPMRHARLRRYEIDPAAVGKPQALGDVAAPVVVLADDGVRRMRDQAGLEAGVVLHGAVPVEVVGRDVEQHADAGRERRGQLDLERGHLDDVDAILGRRLEIRGWLCRCCRPSARPCRQPGGYGR